MPKIESKTLDVLHVASFVGNIGDNANHNGTRSKLKEVFEVPLQYEKSEIRKYYKNYTKGDSLSFDEEFINKANKKDLILIGGGSFFDIWLEDSATGTTIDLTTEQIDRISTPIVFHGLGCIPERDVSDRLIDRFQRFLDHLFASDHVLVSVRNDGSTKNIAETLGESYAEQIRTIPDGAFFVNIDSTSHPEVPQNGTVIGVNIVSDMREHRFPDCDNCISYHEFITEFAQFITELLNKFSDAHIIFIPHIYSDLTAISEVLSEMDVWHRRNRVTTAPYIHGIGSERYIFDIYNSVDISMGLRLHSNICPIGLGTPSIGLANGHPKVNDLYYELDFSEQVVSVQQSGFSEQLLRSVEQTISNQGIIQDQYEEIVQTLDQDLRSFHTDIQELTKSRY